MAGIAGLDWIGALELCCVSCVSTGGVCDSCEVLVNESEGLLSEMAT